MSNRTRPAAAVQALLAATLGLTATAPASVQVMVGGAPVYIDKDAAGDAVASGATPRALRP